MKKTKDHSKLFLVWLPLAFLALLLVGLAVGFPLLMRSCYKSEAKLITADVKVEPKYGQAEFMQFIESLPSCATKSNLQIVIGADLSGDSEKLYQILAVYAQMRLDEAKPKAD